MSDEKFRIPIDTPYLQVTGLALICFARLEWSAVWCCEKLEPGYIGTIEAQRKAAGVIANDFVRMAASHTLPNISSSLGVLAAEFKVLVTRRNDLMHANQATAPIGEQRLFRNGVEWTMDLTEALADNFAALDIELNDFFHRFLCT